MKKSILILVFIFSAALTVYAEGFGGEAGFGVGMLEKDGEKEAVLRLNFNPEFGVGKLSMGFKLGAYFGKDGIADFNANGKTDLGDVDLGFRYIEWKGDILKLRYGTFDNFTLGHGSVIYNYSNNEKTSLRVGLHYPKKMGADVFFPLSKDIFGTPIKEEERPKAMGARAYVRPLNLVGVGIPVISNLEVGTTYIQDVRDKIDVSVSTGGSIYAVETDMELTGNTIEFALPLLNEMCTPYYDMAFVNGKLGDAEGSAEGSFIGVLGQVAIVTYKLEYRNMSENMIPGYFGRFYENNSLGQLQTVVDDNGGDRVQGYFGDLGFNFMQLVILNISYEDYFGGDRDPHLYGKANILPDNGKLNSVITYDQINVGSSAHKDDFLNEDTMIRAKIKAPAALIGIPGPFSANINIEQTYYYDEEKVDYKPKRTYTLGLSFDF